jgi:UDP-N-acetylglucosamine--N-acetylmuramyl-(pentapeptide) pyrophosphoryl-undecaprenol N-acetylglucosamine transferase
MKQKQTQSKKLITLSCGGTGGHMTPAQALGRDLISRGYEVEVITDTRGAKYQPMFEGMKMHVVPAAALGGGVLGKVKSVAGMGSGLVKAMGILTRRKPAMVIGFGGYPSVPGVYAAQTMRIPTIIHEQNAIIGKANAFLAHKAERIALSLPDTQGLDEEEQIRSVVTGNPVRPEIADLYTEPYPSLDKDGPMRILIIGGSLGATVFSDVVPQTLAQLPIDYRSRLDIVQQAREEDIDRVTKAYKQAEITARIAPFFDDMATELKNAHLVITRSGASTVAELTTAGRPAIYVPYPHHKDQQQKKNADAVADAGGAWVMTEAGFTVEALRTRLEMFLQNPKTLFDAAEKAQTCGKPDSARKLGNLVTALVSGW